MRLYDVFSKDADPVDENQTADMRTFFAGADRDKTVQNPDKTNSAEIKSLLAKLIQFGEQSLTQAELIKVREYKNSISLYRRRFEEGVAEGNRPFRGVGGAFNRGDSERHDLDPTDWYIVKDGEMFSASIYPRQVQQAIAQGFSRTRAEAQSQADSQGVAEGKTIASGLNDWQKKALKHDTYEKYVSHCNRYDYPHMDKRAWQRYKNAFDNMGTQDVAEELDQAFVDRMNPMNKKYHTNNPHMTGPNDTVSVNQSGARATRVMPMTAPALVTKKPSTTVARATPSFNKWMSKYKENVEEMQQMIAEGEQMVAEMKQRLDPKCWTGKHKEGTKIKGGVRVNNCVPNESVAEEASPMIKPPANRFDNKQQAFDYAKEHGGKVFKSTYIDPNTGIKNITFVVKKEPGVVEASNTMQRYGQLILKRARAAREYNLDAAQREMDRRAAEGEDMTGATIDKDTYEIVKPKQQGVAEGSLNELSKKTLRSYSKDRSATIRADQRDAEAAADMADDYEVRGNGKKADEWDDESKWLKQRSEKGAGNVAKATIKIAKKPLSVVESHDSEDLANEVYAEFEKTYPNLARRADERTIHAAIMDVLNYGGDNNPGALAQDVARAVKQDMQQGVAEGATDDPRFQKMMGNIQKSTPALVSGYVALNFASEQRSKKIKGVSQNGKPIPDVINNPEEFLGGKIEFTPNSIEQQLMAIGKKYGWDSIDSGQGQGYTEMFFDTNKEYTSNNQNLLAANIANTVSAINKFFNGMNSSLQATGLPEYKTDVWQGMGPPNDTNQIGDLSQIVNIAKGKSEKLDPGTVIGKMILKYIPSYEAENDELGYDPQAFTVAKAIANTYITQGERAGLEAQGSEIAVKLAVSDMIDELLSDAGGSGLRTIWDLNEQGVAEAGTSAAVRLGRAIQRTQGRTAASQARSVIPSSIPKKEEPKKDEKKVDEGIQAGDGFIIECGDSAIETVVLGSYNDGILIEFDHTATFMLTDAGITLTEAEYQGRTVPLGKRMAGDVKKSKVYVKKPNGNVVKVNFGDKNMTIKKHLPKHRKSYRARHHCENPGPKWKANYWSCRAW